MSKLLINAVTVSVAFSDKEYGKGQEFFQNISAKTPDAGIPLEELSDVVDQSLDLFFAAWKAILTDRFVAGAIKGKEYKEILAAGEARIDKIRSYLKNHEPSKHSQPTEG
jgi:hypothetical protein